MKFINIKKKKKKKKKREREKRGTIFGDPASPTHAHMYIRMYLHVYRFRNLYKYVL